MVIAAMLTTGAGCAKMTWKPSKIFSLDSTWPFRDPDEPREGTPTRMVSTWTDTVLTKPGQKPQRGFGGRIMFYEEGEKNPVIVDGQLVVYAFDETDRDPIDNKPTRRYVFPAEQVPLHMSKSDFGTSYSFWLPWDEVGGPETKVSLICRFEPKGGAVVAGEQTPHLLPGTPRTQTAKGDKKPPKLPEGVPSKPVIPTLQSLQTQRTEERNAQLASYKTPAPTGHQPATAAASHGVNAAPVRKMTSTTINLPNNFQMPSAAALMNPAPTSPPGQTNLVPPLQQQLPQQVAPTSAPPPTTLPVTQAAFHQPVVPVGYGMPVQQLQTAPRGNLMPGPPTGLQAPQPFGLTPVAQVAPSQQVGEQQVSAAMLAALQQQMQQQQQQAVNQNAIPQQPAAATAANPLSSQYR